MHYLVHVVLILFTLTAWLPADMVMVPPMISVTEPSPMEPVEDVTDPVILWPEIEEPTEPVITEPIYETINIPIFEFALPETFKTIYDVEEAIAYARDAVAEYDAILNMLPLKHPQYGDVTSLKIGALNYIDECQAVLDEHWTSREDKRPVMTHIWHNLKDRGYSDAVVAGIIGNLIAETGGMGYQDIEWNIRKNGYYGICMWSLKYVPQVDRTSLDEQLDYLVKSMEREFNTVYSKTTRNKFGLLKLRYKDFVEIDNPYDAAIAFGVCYERPSVKHIARRGPQAEKAYEYFVTLGSWPWPGK